MIHKVNPLINNIKGVPEKGSKLLMHNPVFPNPEYTMVYSKISRDVVYTVVEPDFKSHRISLNGPGKIYGCHRFACKDGFDKHFMHANGIFRTTIKQKLKDFK